eukprot:TRINITY_DN105401_c0_g1_i1.p1 TRINITY_DN105401_c0_g1~~TRINITY_DN105401_c0_g1_i1.p1  ORF type:complete len:599 (-),score=38.43 TRINITY_DN105401_c0_g1_i1:1271-3067(-)
MYNLALYYQRADDKLKVVHCLTKAVNLLKKQPIKVPSKEIARDAEIEGWSEYEKSVETKKCMHYLKLCKDQLVAKLHLQLCSVFSQMKRYKDALSHARLAITHSHNFVMESCLLCKVLSQKRRYEPNMVDLLQTTSGEFLHTTLSRLHTFNMTKETETATIDTPTHSSKAFYFGDKVRVLDKLVTQYAPILKELMRKVTEVEKYLNKDKEDIVEFANSLSPRTRQPQVISDLRTKKQAKIKQRNLIGLKSKKDFIYTVNIEDFTKLAPLAVDDLVPDFQNMARELHRDSVYKKVVLLAIVYYTYGDQCKLVYEKTNLATQWEEARYWHKMTTEVCHTFLPESAPIVQRIATVIKEKRELRKEFKENKEIMKKPKKTGKASALGFVGPAKLKKPDTRINKVHTSLGIRAGPFTPRSPNILQGRTPMKFLQHLQLSLFSSLIPNCSNTQPNICYYILSSQKSQQLYMPESAPLILAIVGIITFLLTPGIHRIDEGHVGVYYRGGALLEGITEPGYHWMIPFITSYANIQVTVQTDKVTDIPVFCLCYKPLNSVGQVGEWSFISKRQKQQIVLKRITYGKLSRTTQWHTIKRGYLTKYSTI